MSKTKKDRRGRHWGPDWATSIKAEESRKIKELLEDIKLSRDPRFLSKHAREIGMRAEKIADIQKVLILWDKRSGKGQEAPPEEASK